MGIQKAGFQVTGIDINPQPEYPFEFIQEDVLSLNADFISEFDFIWSSPPCQAYSWASKRWNKEYPDLVHETRELLNKSGRPFVIENVNGAPIRKDLMLCGEMFKLGVIRHRYFEINKFWVQKLKHRKHKGTVREGAYCTVAGHGGDGKASLKAWQESIGVDWISDKKQLAQVVPPVYSNYIVKQFLKYKDAYNLWAVRKLERQLTLI